MSNANDPVGPLSSSPIEVSGEAASPGAVPTEFLGNSRSGIHKMAPPLNRSSVLGKVGIILQEFTADNATRGISEIARSTGLAKATVFRLCKEMVELGLLDRHWGEYRLGLRLFELGALVQRQRLLHEIATPFLQDLRLSTNETIHLGIPQAGEVFYVSRLSGHQSQTAPSRIAGRRPMHCTATGKAMLAHLPETLLDELMSRPLTAYTPSTIVVRHVLDDELGKIRELGIAVENEEMELGFRSVAAPVFGPGRRILGAVSVTGPSSRIAVESVTSVVRTAGKNISDSVSSCWDLV